MAILLSAAAFVGAAGELENVPYYPEDVRATATAYQNARCRLDVRTPDGMTNFATVVWLHGGGLVGGSKHFVALPREIAQVAVNYRLLGGAEGVTGDDCIADAAAAVAWTLRNVAAYGGNAKKVYVSGMSAGGYLTMMVGMDPSRLAPWGHRPTDLAGIVPISGQATTHFNVRKSSGDRAPQFLPKIDRLAPLAFCGKDLPPILDICGEPPWEWKCRAEENRLLIASCRALGHPDATFVECDLCSHGRVCDAAVPYLAMFVQGRLSSVTKP